MYLDSEHIGRVPCTGGEREIRDLVTVNNFYKHAINIVNNSSNFEFVYEVLGGSAF